MNDYITQGLPSLGSAKVSIPSTPSFSTPSIANGIPHIPGYTRRNNYNKKQTQHAKGLGDLLLGDPFLGTKQLQDTLLDNDSVFTYVPILNRFAGLYHMTRERFINPMIEGELGKTFINALETVGDTLDIAANPVKSLMPWAGGGTGDDFLRSMGWLEGEYRKTYQWDTGNFLLDFLGEMVSDPINWVTWGASGVAKKSTTELLPEAKHILQDIKYSQTINKQTVNYKLLDAMQSLSKDEYDKVLRALTESLGSKNADVLSKKLDDIFVDQVVSYGADKGKQLLNSTAYKLNIDKVSLANIKNQLYQASNNGMFDAYKTIISVRDAAKAFDKGLAKVAYGLTPFGWSVATVRYVIKPSYAYVNHSILKRMKDVEKEVDVNRKLKLFENAKKEHYIKGELVSDYVKTGMKDLLDKHDLTYEKLANIYMDSIFSSQLGMGATRDPLTLKNLFRRNLQSMMPGVYFAEPNDSIWKIIGNSENVQANILYLKVPLNKTGLRNISVVVPEHIYNDLFWELWSNNKTLIQYQTKLINQSLDLFYEDMKRNFNPDKIRESMYRASTDLRDISRLEINKKGVEEVLLKEKVDEMVKYTNKSFGRLKELAYKLLSADSDWGGSYMDKQIFWQKLKEHDPSTTYTTLGSILGIKLGKNATEEMVQYYKEYETIYNALTNKVRKGVNKSIMRFDLFNTHDKNSVGVILDTYYDLYNGTNRDVIRRTEFSLRDKLQYIDGGYLKIKDKVYDLEILDEYFKDAERLGIDITKQKAILEYFGINTTNAPVISRKFLKRDALSMNELKLMLSQGKTGHRAYSAQLDNFKNIHMKKVPLHNRTVLQHQIDKVNKIAESSEIDIPSFDERVLLSLKRVQDMNEYLKNLKYTNVPANEMPLFEKMIKASGLQLNEFDELWRSILELDYTKLDATSYLDIHNKAIELSSLIENIRKNAPKGKRIPPNTAQFLYEIKATLDDIVIPSDTTVADLIDLSQSIYMPLISREGMSNVLIDKEFNDFENVSGRFLNEIKKPDSVARSKILDLASRLEELQYTTAGEQLRELVLHIDNHIAVNRLLQINIEPLYIKYDKRSQDLVNAILYNRIASDAYKNMTPEALLQNFNKILDECMEDVDSFLNKRITEYAEDTIKLIETSPLKYYADKYAQYGSTLIPFNSKTLEDMPKPFKEMSNLEWESIKMHLRDPGVQGTTIPDIKAVFIRHGEPIADLNDPRDVSILAEHLDLTIPQFKELIKTQEDLEHVTLFHELKHVMSKEYKKQPLEDGGVDYKLIKYELEARRKSVRDVTNIRNAEAIKEAELRNIKASYAFELESYLNLLINNDANLGLNNSYTYDILDNKLATLIRTMGEDKDKLLEGLRKLDIDTTEIRSDYDTVIELLYGKSEITKKNAALIGIKSINFLDSNTLEDLNDIFDHATYMDNIKEALNYIGLENQKLGAFTDPNRKIATAQHLYTIEQINQALNENGMMANLKEWSMANRNIAFKKVFDPEFAKKWGITPVDNIVSKSQSEYLEFYEAWVKAYDRVKNIYSFYDLDSLQNVKEKLIETYSHAGLKGAPINAETYFRLLDINNLEDRIKIMTWDGLTQDLHRVTNATRKYNSLATFRNPWEWYNIIDTTFQDNMWINVDGVADILKMDPPDYILTELYNRFDYSLESLYKSPEKLSKDVHSFAKLINDDLYARRHTVDTLETMMSELNEKRISKELAEEVGLRPGLTQASGEVQTYLKETVQRDLARTYNTATLPQLRTLVDESGGFIIYMAEEGEEVFNFTEQELAQHGLLLYKQADDIYFLRRTDNIMHNEEINWVRTLSEEFDDALEFKESILEHNKTYIDLEGTRIPWYYITGDTMDNNLYDYLINSEHFETFFGSKSVQDLYLKYDFRDKSSFYTKSYSRPQLTILGRDGYNRFITYLHNDLDVPINFTRKATRLNVSLQAGMVDWITRHNSKTKMLSLFFNDEFHLDNELFHNLLDNLSNKELRELFKRGKYTAAVIKQDHKGHIKVFKEIITSKADLRRAREIGAHIFPEQVYRNMVFTINKNETTSKLMMLYRRTIVGAFKSIWLTSPGFLLRNFLDSDVYKNMNEMGGSANLIEMFQYEYQASKVLDMVNQVHAEVFARTNGRTFNRDILTNVLMNMSYEDRVLYYLADTFMNTGASGSLTESMQEFLLSFNKGGVETAEYLWERSLNQALFESNLSPIKHVMDVNGKIEQSARFGLFLALIDKKGLDIDEALARVIRTHFDYTVKSGFEDMLEQLFWFVTFPINNVLYFVNEGLERNPVMLKVMMDLNELSWNNGEYTYDELKEKPYLQYHAMQGNIRWRSKDGKKDYILKLGPSLFDFFNIMIDPIGEGLNRLNPFISVPTGLDEPTELIPFYSQIKRGKQLLSGNSLIPSIYNTQQVKKYFNPKRTYYNNGGSWNFRTKPKRPSKVYKPRIYISNAAYRGNKYWGRKYYIHDNRWNNKYMKPITYEPYWDPTSNKYRGAFNMNRRRYIRLPNVTPEMRQFIQNNKREIK